MTRPQGSCSLRNMGSIFYCLFIRPRPHVFGYFLKRTFFSSLQPFVYQYTAFSGTKMGEFLKRGVPEVRFLKTPASRSLLDERKQRFSCTMISYIMCSQHYACFVVDINYRIFIIQRFQVDTQIRNMQHMAAYFQKISVFKKYPDLSRKACGLTIH